MANLFQFQLVLLRRVTSVMRKETVSVLQAQLSMRMMTVLDVWSRMVSRWMTEAAVCVPWSEAWSSMREEIVYVQNHMATDSTSVASVSSVSINLL
jgi:hypothetical protein